LPNSEGSERRTFGADVEVFASLEERALEAMPDPAKGSGIEEKREGLPRKALNN
jgi:hypothetical protein